VKKTAAFRAPGPAQRKKLYFGGMANMRRLATVAAILAMVGIPAFAHHAFSSEFDFSKPVTLEGVVTRVDWENPHVHFFIDVTDANGTTVNWSCETGGPRRLISRGWNRDSMKIGDKVTVRGSLARDGSHLVDGRQVTMPDGRRIFSGPSR
jgi:hypothetical protein